MDTVGDDVLGKILLKIPDLTVELVLALKTMSKQWQDVITSHPFTEEYSKKHLKQKSLVAHSGDCVSIFVEHQEKYIVAMDNLELVGSVNGIVALLRGSVLCFLNPLTRYSYDMRLPQELQGMQQLEGDKIGFGFDDDKKTFKFVVRHELTTWVCRIKAKGVTEKKQTTTMVAKVSYNNNEAAHVNRNCWSSWIAPDIFGSRLEFDDYDSYRAHTMRGFDPVWVQTKKGWKSIQIIYFDMQLEKFKRLCDFPITKTHVSVSFLELHGIFSALQCGSFEIDIFNYSEAGGWYQTSTVEIGVGPYAPNFIQGLVNTDGDVLIRNESGLYLCGLDGNRTEIVYGGTHIKYCVTHTPSIYHLPRMRGIDHPPDTVISEFNSVPGLRNVGRLITTLRDNFPDESNNYEVEKKTASPASSSAAEEYGPTPP